MNQRTWDISGGRKHKNVKMKNHIPIVFSSPRRFHNLRLKSDFFLKYLSFFLKFENTEIFAFHQKILFVFFTKFEKKLKLPPQQT